MTEKLLPLALKSASHRELYTQLLDNLTIQYPPNVFLTLLPPNASLAFRYGCCVKRVFLAFLSFFR